MAYDMNFPADDSYLSDFPAGNREQNRALKDDQIVNAGKLQGLTAGNKNGQIPINNGTENINLNAALLNGKASSYFATSNHIHNTATQSSNGYMSNADKKKLDGIASGAEVNQNAFSNIKIGSTTIQADGKQDTLELVAGINIVLTPDNNNDKITIGVSGKVTNATHADNADYATNATHADNANNATNATHADNADYATNATHADNATNATHADDADYATNAYLATKTSRDGEGNDIISTYINKSEKGISVATLEDGKIPVSQLPELEDNVGEIAFRPYLKDGYVKLNGALVSRHDYPRLVELADKYNLWTSNPTNEPYKFGIGNAYTTFVLPDYRNRVIQGGDNVGVLNAGLPNIKGFFKALRYDEESKESGAFNLKEKTVNVSTASGNNSGTGEFEMDASRYNAIYGNSETVQPPSIVLIPQMKY